MRGRLVPWRHFIDSQQQVRKVSYIVNNRKRIANSDPLAEPMRLAAQRLRPEFSAALDARLRAALHAAATTDRRARDGAWREFRINLLSWTVAAAASITLLVSSAVICRTLVEGSGQTIAQTKPPDPAQTVADDIDSTTALVEDSVADLGQWMATAVDDNQWAGLDRDAQAAMATVTASLPFELSAALAAADRQE